MLIAVLSDIHGNSFALKEVLKDINKRRVDKIIDLGDSLYGPLDPKGTFDILNNARIESIRGNQDRVIVENWSNNTENATLEYVKAVLPKEAYSWLNALPFERKIGNEVYCCHACPNSDSLYLLEKITNSGVLVKEEQELFNLITKIEKQVILVGHSHTPKFIHVGQKCIINPGSVGLQAYDDASPCYHKMETFNPCAKYAIVELIGISVKVDHVSVHYDYNTAAKLAEKNDRPDWAKWIKTGRV